MTRGGAGQVGGNVGAVVLRQDMDVLRGVSGYLALWWAVQFPAPKKPSVKGLHSSFLFGELKSRSFSSLEKSLKT